MCFVFLGFGPDLNILSILPLTPKPEVLNEINIYILSGGYIGHIKDEKQITE